MPYHQEKPNAFTIGKITYEKACTGTWFVGDQAVYAEVGALLDVLQVAAENRPRVGWEENAQLKSRVAEIEACAKSESVRAAKLADDRDEAWKEADRWKGLFTESAKQAQDQLTELRELRSQVKHLQDFKDYAHKRLTLIGVPQDPDPELTAKTGCRIGVRFDYVRDLLMTRPLQGEIPASIAVHLDPLQRAAVEKAGFTITDGTGHDGKAPEASPRAAAVDAARKRFSYQRGEMSQAHRDTALAIADAIEAYDQAKQEGGGG